MDFSRASFGLIPDHEVRWAHCGYLELFRRWTVCRCGGKLLEVPTPTWVDVVVIVRRARFMSSLAELLEDSEW